jgi:hypothetical protein
MSLRGIAAVIAISAALLVAFAIGFATLLIQDIGVVESYDCTLDRPRTAFVILAAMTAASVVGAALTISRWPRVGWTLVLANAVLVYAWSAAGGWDAANCAGGV